MSYIGKKNGNPNTDFLEAGGELENHDLVAVDSSGRIITPTVNRTSTDGDVITIAKDGTTVGSIGVAGSNRPYFARNGVDGITFSADGDLLPSTLSGGYNDGGANLGVDSVRWNNLYLSGTLTNDGTGGISIDSNGYVTMSNQPSMFITGNQDTYATLVTKNGVANTVPFNLVKSGNGTGFSTTNHTFTAPVAGNYLISVWGLVTTSVTYNHIEIYKNAGRITRGFDEGRGGQGHTIALTLSENDYVQIRSDEALYLHSTSTYSGLSITLVS